MAQVEVGFGMLNRVGDKTFFVRNDQITTSETIGPGEKRAVGHDKGQLSLYAEVDCGQDNTGHYRIALGKGIFRKKEVLEGTLSEGLTEEYYSSRGDQTIGIRLRIVPES